MNNSHALEIMPVLRSALDGDWFVAIELLGVVAFAVSGLVLARRDKFSLVGAFVLAGLPAAGGGIMRDLLLGRPIAFLAAPIHLALIVGTVAVGFVVFRIIDLHRSWDGRGRTGRFSQNAATAIEFFDALGLASFTVTGVVVAVESSVGPLLLWGPLFAMLTASGGGILRDVVRADSENPALKRVFYTEVALIWGLLLSAFLSLFASGLGATAISGAIAVAMAGAFTTRWLAVAFDWTSPRFSLQTGVVATDATRPTAEVRKHSQHAVAALHVNAAPHADTSCAPVSHKQPHLAARSISRPQRKRRLAALRLQA